MMPLTMVRPGETVTIRKITGKDEVRQHLAELGFVIEEGVTVVSEIGGNLILQHLFKFFGRLPHHIYHTVILTDSTDSRGKLQPARQPLFLSKSTDRTVVQD